MAGLLAHELNALLYLPGFPVVIRASSSSTVTGIATELKFNLLPFSLFTLIEELRNHQYETYSISIIK